MDALKSAEVVRLGEGDPWVKAATEQSVDAIIEALGLEPSSPVSGC
jgi:siroheme synthase